MIDRYRNYATSCNVKSEAAIFYALNREEEKGNENRNYNKRNRPKDL